MLPGLIDTPILPPGVADAAPKDGTAIGIFSRGMAMEPDILLMDEPFAALDALTRQRMQDELLGLWEDTRFTVLFVTHSIAEAVKIGNRVLLLSPHPGQVKAELNSVPLDAPPIEAAALEARIHGMLFADRIEEPEHV